MAFTVQMLERKIQELTEENESLKIKLERQEPSTLPKFLDAVHQDCQIRLKTNIVGGSKVFENGDKKFMPVEVHEWTKFEGYCRGVLDSLYRSDFGQTRKFSSLIEIQLRGASLANRDVVVEKEVEAFLVQNFQEPVQQVFNAMYEDEAIRLENKLTGLITQSNQSRKIVPRIENSVARKTPRADVFYTISDEVGKPGKLVLMGEHKGPNLTPDLIRKGLDEMKRDENRLIPVDNFTEPSPTDPEGDKMEARRIFGAVICQIFDYLVLAGIKYGYISTGEAFIFLKVAKDPKKIKYFLFVPKDLPEKMSDSQVGLTTAVGLMLGLLLKAAITRPRDNEWIKKYTVEEAHKLKKWDNQKFRTEPDWCSTTTSESETMSEGYKD